MSLSIIALFAMQASWSYTFKMIYMWVTYLLVTIFSTCCNMPFGALNGVLTSDSGERAKLSGLRMVFANVSASWAPRRPRAAIYWPSSSALSSVCRRSSGLPIRSRKWSSRRSIRSRSR